ncbi:hypothetical protein [Phenylobacterium sp.]|uniref:hypothetical protein n=1 Tax=Phenylobacterium sp. TaxID=1871053 RepID=UPI002DEFD53D|nr:hypothetical protein [Phenylobacterium sp.]
MAQDDRTFRTSTPEANRAETQGLGVGQRELDAQRSPGEPDGLLDEDIETDETPSRRGLKTEAERGQGAKTRQLNKDIVSRRT